MIQSNIASIASTTVVVVVVVVFIVDVADGQHATQPNTKNSSDLEPYDMIKHILILPYSM